MGCTSAKQVSAVPNDEEGHGKAYSNGDLYSDEYKLKGVEEVKYMRGEENRVNARNQENLGSPQPVVCLLSTLSSASSSSPLTWQLHLRHPLSDVFPVSQHVVISATSS
ncbi:uncharacterized protein C1orf21 homolog isoform X2 [Cynoglossus semilaevis]|uniref:uncharacterized protein C1orf21 homolog isoform X2 n=1 Tax=Cynoglossus semilaevis TaxID=244447 RepID=UPI000D630D2E|nr:uncharacterized protein C1orf21 homolog isoform X2 [Cynoglossus semilaevis]